MSKLRIKDAPILPNVDGSEKIPTGGRGDYAVSVDQIKDYARGGLPQQIEDHINDTNNPHQVTKEQVGLGHADNTSDVDKPISTATQEALDLKANQSTTYTKIEVDGSLGFKADKTYVDSRDLLKADKTYVDSALAGFSNGAAKFYPTLAEANADIANIALKDKVEVGEAVNGGVWYKATAGATTLTKSPYDPLTQAKADATTKANAAEANAKTYADTNKLDLSKITTGYVDGNKIGPKTPRYTNLGVTGIGGNVSTSSNFDSVVLQVKEGDDLYIENSANTFISANGARLSFFAEDPNLNRTQTAITHTATNITTPVNHWKIVVPVGAKYLMLNTRSVVAGTTYNLDWSVHENAYDPSFAAGDETVTSIQGVDVGDYAKLAADKAELNAKTYAETRLKLVRPIIASNKVSDTLQNLENSTVALSGGTVQLVAPKVGSFVYLVEVEPNTEYTIVNTITTSPSIREFSSKPISSVSRLEANAGQTLSMVTYQTTPSLRRQATFTTGSDTRYITLDMRDYTGHDFVLVEGAFGANIEASLVAPADEANKKLTIDHLDVKNLKSDNFTSSKNLFAGYTFGASVNSSRAVSSEYESLLWSPGFAPTQVGYWDRVGAVVAVQPNTTYTISKESSDAFTVLLCKDLSTSKVVVRDVSLRSYTVTTGAEDNFIAVALSTIGEQPLVQVEKGSQVTAYESKGVKFKEAALPLGFKLTDSKKQTDNTYITLGLQTDKFMYPTPTRIDYSTVIDNLYEPLRASHSGISRNTLGKDSSDTYDIHEYIFEPDSYEQSIVITAGMHPTELVTYFALGILLNEIYRNPEKHEGLAYLKNKVKITVIPVVNTWGVNQNPKTVPIHYLNPNYVNPARNFPERWNQIIEDGPYNRKGTAPLSEKETQYMLEVMSRNASECSFNLDLHTAQGQNADTMIYWLEEDNFLRPVLENIVSMRNSIVRDTLGREPVNEAWETASSTKSYHSQRVLGVPSATIEYGTGSSINLSSEQTTYYTDLLFNCVHYALKADLLNKRKQARMNEHNKQFVSLYNTLTAHNNVVNFLWSYSQLQTNLYDNLGLTKSVIGAASGSYSLVKYVHAPVGYKNTVVLSAGLRGKDTRKSVTELGFFAHKLMTDTNPHIVALRNNTRFIFIPCLNPHGYDNNIVNNANAVQPYLNFSTSTQPESVVLRSFIDSETIDLFVDIDSLLNESKPSGYTNLQVIHNAKSDIEYGSMFSVLNAKYAVSNPANAASYSTALVKSQIADYINSKGIAYTYNFFAQNVLPLRTTVRGNYVDLGYEANEMAYCAEVMFNSIKEICQRRTLSKYLAN